MIFFCKAKTDYRNVCAIVCFCRIYEVMIVLMLDKLTGNDIVANINLVDVYAFL